MSTILKYLDPSHGQKYPLGDLTTLPNIIFATTAFALLWSWIRRYVERHGPIDAFYQFGVWHGLYSIFSLVMCVLIVREVLLGEGYRDLWLRRIYHFSKFYEYVDVLLLVGQGEVVDSYTAFYHLAMPFFTFFRVLNCPDQWQPFAALNCLHTFVSLGRSIGMQSLSGSTIAYVTQILQLGTGIAVDAIWFLKHGTADSDSDGKVDAELLAGEDEERFGRAVALLLLFRLAQLYWRERGQEEARKKADTVAAQKDTDGPEVKAKKLKKDRGESKKTK